MAGENLNESEAAAAAVHGNRSSWPGIRDEDLLPDDLSRGLKLTFVVAYTTIIFTALSGNGLMRRCRRTNAHLLSSNTVGDAGLSMTNKDKSDDVKVTARIGLLNSNFNAGCLYEQETSV